MTNLFSLTYKSELKRLSEKIAVELIYSDMLFPMDFGCQQIHGNNPHPSLLMQYVPLLTSELNFYPLSFVRISGLQRIYLLSRLEYMSQRLAGFCLIARHAIYQDISYINYSEKFAAFALHHEFFHCVNFFALGNFVQDAEWERLNTSKFRYGVDNNGLAPNEQPLLMSHPVPGFVNSHSTSNIAEDKATIFAYLMCQYSDIEDLASRDQILHAKVAKLKECLEATCAENDAPTGAELRGI